MHRPDEKAQNSPYFHSGELFVQERYGARDRIHAAAQRIIRDHLNEQHREFYRQLPFLIVGSVDGEGQPWASLLAGEAGFAHALDPYVLRVEAAPFTGDPLAENLGKGAPIGLLGIDISTRRRNRISTRVAGFDGANLDLKVLQSFGNCPQYIQVRDLVNTAPSVSPTIETSECLSAEDCALVEASHTFFIASAHAGSPGDVRAGADVSHRGGRPGFIRVDDTCTMTVPDFVGNFVFNTLGNLVLEPRAGLLFVDFASGDVIMIACHAEIIWNHEDIQAFVGAQRLLRFHISKVVRLRAATSLRAFGDVVFSREVQRTGTWRK